MRDYERGIKVLRAEYKIDPETWAGRYRLYSVAAPSEGAIEYFIGNAVSPKLGCGPLSVYTYDAAKVPIYLFDDFCCRTEVYECLFQPVEGRKFWTPSSEHRVPDFKYNWSFATNVVLLNRLTIPSF